MESPKWHDPEIIPWLGIMVTNSGWGAADEAGTFQLNLSTVSSESWYRWRVMGPGFSGPASLIQPPSTHCAQSEDTTEGHFSPFPGQWSLLICSLVLRSSADLLKKVLKFQCCVGILNLCLMSYGPEIMEWRSNILPRTVCKLVLISWCTVHSCCIGNVCCWIALQQHMLLSWWAKAGRLRPPGSACIFSGDSCTE